MENQFYDNQQQFGAQQPANWVAKTTETAFANDHSHEHKKTRFTRAERRQFANEKRESRVAKKSAHKKNTKAPHQDFNSIDDVIAYLVSLRDRTGDRKFNLSHGIKGLEQRNARDAAKKAEPSARKLEKIQKRKEIRAERRKAKLEQRVQQAKQDGASQATNSALPSQPEQTATTVTTEIDEIDEINFDEL